MEGSMPDEKFDEKEAEKREEKSPDEKYRRDPLGTITWAAILIWAGLVLLAGNLGYLKGWGGSLAEKTGLTTLRALDGWEFVFLGAGVLILIEILIRILVPAYRKPITGSLILAIILIAIGLGDVLTWTVLGPVILIILGLSILLRGIFRK
jgi:hypothetical protein